MLVLMAGGGAQGVLNHACHIVCSIPPHIGQGQELKGQGMCTGVSPAALVTWAGPLSGVAKGKGVLQV